MHLRPSGLRHELLYHLTSGTAKLVVPLCLLSLKLYNKAPCVSGAQKGHVFDNPNIRPAQVVSR